MRREVAQHVRNGEIWISRREWIEAVRELERAEFEIKCFPYDLADLKERLVYVQRRLDEARQVRP